PPRRGRGWPRGLLPERLPLLHLRRLLPGAHGRDRKRGHADERTEPRLRQRPDAGHDPTTARVGAVYLRPVPVLLQLLPQIRLRAGRQPLPVLVATGAYSRVY